MDSQEMTVIALGSKEEASGLSRDLIEAMYTAAPEEEDISYEEALRVARHYLARAGWKLWTVREIEDITGISSAAWLEMIRRKSGQKWHHFSPMPDYFRDAYVVVAEATAVLQGGHVEISYPNEYLELIYHRLDSVWISGGKSELISLNDRVRIGWRWQELTVSKSEVWVTYVPYLNWINRTGSPLQLVLSDIEDRLPQELGIAPRQVKLAHSLTWYYGEMVPLLQLG